MPRDDVSQMALSIDARTFIRVVDFVAPADGDLADLVVKNDEGPFHILHIWHYSVGSAAVINVQIQSTNVEFDTDVTAIAVVTGSPIQSIADTAPADQNLVDDDESLQVRVATANTATRITVQITCLRTIEPAA